MAAILLVIGHATQGIVSGYMVIGHATQGIVSGYMVTGQPGFIHITTVTKRKGVLLDNKYAPFYFAKPSRMVLDGLVCNLSTVWALKRQFYYLKMV